MSRATSPACKTTTWPADNKALKRRGSLTIWFDPEMTWAAVPTGKRGRQPDCSGEQGHKTVQRGLLNKSQVSDSPRLSGNERR